MITELLLSVVSRSRTSRCLLFSISPAVALLVLGGCSTTTKPVVGAINVINASGAAQPPITSPLPLVHGAQAKFIVNVTNDAEGLGADWTATCTSTTPGGGLVLVDDPTICGSFSPAHTTSGPVPTYPYPAATVYITTYNAPGSAPSQGGTVTITANATSLPSSTSSITLTIQ